MSGCKSVNMADHTSLGSWVQSVSGLVRVICNRAAQLVQTYVSCPCTTQTWLLLSLRETSRKAYAAHTHLETLLGWSDQVLLVAYADRCLILPKSGLPSIRGTSGLLFADLSVELAPSLQTRQDQSPVGVQAP